MMQTSRSEISRALGALICAVCLLHCALAPEAAAQRASPVPPEARQLVVNVIGYFEDVQGPTVGAGIIVGEGRGQLYIATAGHVVRRGTREAGNLAVILESARTDSLSATLMPQADSSLDLAVITVPSSAVPAHAARPLRFDRRGDVRSLRFGDEVSPVGCPRGQCWEAPARPDRFVYVLGDEIGFESAAVGPGHSGGALFNAWWEIVGLIEESSPPRGSAISIDRVIAQVRAWGYPVDLTKASIPRRGYHTTVELALLGPMSSSGGYLPDGRVPSGRVMLSHQVFSVVSVHAGVVRLTRDRLGVTAGMAGVGMRLKKGRFAAHPFVEAGLGHVEGQYDAGPFFLEGAGEQPVLMTLEDDGLGAGAGFACEVILAPRAILNLVVGHWEFYRPENEPELQDVPDVPDLFLGGGLRIGL